MIIKMMMMMLLLIMTMRLVIMVKMTLMAGLDVYFFQACLIIAAAFSPIMIVGVLVFPETMYGMMDASATRSPVNPCTLWAKNTIKLKSIK